MTVLVFKLFLRERYLSLKDQVREKKGNIVFLTLDYGKAFVYGYITEEEIH